MSNSKEVAAPTTFVQQQKLCRNMSGTPSTWASTPGTHRVQLGELSRSASPGHRKVAWIFNKYKLSKHQVYIQFE